MRIVQGMLFLRGLWWSVTASAGEVAASDRGQLGFAPLGAVQLRQILGGRYRMDLLPN